MSWSPDNGSKLAISYCDTSKVREITNTTSYVWEIENPNKPLYTLQSPSSSICLEYNNKESNLLISGMLNGQVGAFDVRASNNPIMLSEPEVSHRAQVNSTVWINSKTGSEFFSGSSDGQVIWWDFRKPDEPTEKLLMDPLNVNEQVGQIIRVVRGSKFFFQDINRAYGVSVMEYESTMPARFMAGTEQGMLFACNRKGKSPMEQIQLRVSCNYGEKS